MKNKVLSLLVFGIFALAIFASFASATIVLSTSSITFKPFELTKTFTITTEVDNTPLTLPSTATIPDNQNPAKIVMVTFGSPVITGTANPGPGNLLNLDRGETATVTTTLTGTIPSDFTLGTFSTNYIVSETASPTNNATLKVYFENTPNKFHSGHLQIDTINNNDFSVKGFGEDNKWYPLDEISVEVEVRNTGTKEINNIEIEWVLYDKTTGNWVIDGNENDFDLNDGDRETKIITFKLDDVSEFNVGDGYVFYAWATGDEEISPTVEERVSIYTSTDINMQFDDDLVVLNNVQFDQSPAACGSQVQVTADVVNIGSDDQSDVAVKIYNAALGINQKVTIGDIDRLEEDKLVFTFTIPSDANEGDYEIAFIPIDSKLSTYESELNKETSSATATLAVSGSCIFNPKLTVTASSTDAIAGKEVDVTATIKNTALTARTFLVTATNFDSWASLTSVSPTSLNLAAGETKQVLVKLNINADTSGEQTFNVQLTGDGKIIPQPVTVTVQKAPGFFNFLTGNVVKGNWYLWAIGGLNVLLLLIIIIVAVRVSRKK